MIIKRNNIQPKKIIIRVANVCNTVAKLKVAQKEERMIHADDT